MSESNELNSANKVRLICDLKQIVADTDSLLHTTVDLASDKVAGLHDRIQRNLKVARGRLDKFEVALVGNTAEITREALQKTLEAVNQAYDAAREASQMSEESVRKTVDSGKITARKAVAATREASGKALDALSKWLG